MNDLDELIQFLRLNRRLEQTLKEDKTDIVSAIVLDTDEQIDIDRSSFENLDTYKRLFRILEDFSATRIYYTINGPDRKYYINLSESQSLEVGYLNIDTRLAEQVDENNLSYIEIRYAFDQYIFDTTRKKVLVVTKGLEGVNAFSDAIVFDPDYLDVATGTYIYTFDDHKTLFNNITNAIFKPLSNFIQLKDREVSLYKADTSGSIYLIPRIAYRKGKYTITYLYAKSKRNFSGNLAQEDIALQLEFNFVGAFISFLNETILLEPNFNYLDEEASDRRLDFIEEFEEIIVGPLERNINGSSSGNYKDALTVLYYLGNDILFSLSQDTLWKVLDEAIKNDNLVNHSENAEEDIVLKIIGFMAEREENKDNFLIKLLEKTSHDKMSYLQFLYDRIDGENSKNFVKIIHKAWQQSSFIEIDPEKSKIITNDSPVILDYRSNTTLAFHTDNAEVEWKINTISVNLTVGTGIYQTSEIRDGHGGTKTKTEEVMETFHYNYHPFSPIALINADNPTFLFKDAEQQNQAYTLLPAFVIYAHTKSAFVKNWLTVAEYTVDILTTLSGFGNILKVGRLYKILEAGKTIAGKTQIFTKIVTGVKGAAGVAEISSGSVNILLKLTGLNETDLGREISKYLFYFEMIALSGELSLALYEKMQKSAKIILGEKKLLRESAKNADEAKQVDELIEELRITAGVDSKILLNNKEFLKHLEDLKYGRVVRAYPELLTLEEEAVLRFYTTNVGYKNFNKALRGEIEMTDEFLAQKQLMNQALDKLPIYKTDALLYRIENLTDAQIEEYYKIGEEVTNKHFTSSSYDMFSIGEAMRKRKFTVLIRIETKTGKLIEPVSTFKDEGEVLFKSNTSFYVDKFTENINPLDPFDSKIKTIIIKEK